MKILPLFISPLGVNFYINEPPEGDEMPGYVQDFKVHKYHGVDE